MPTRKTPKKTAPAVKEKPAAVDLHEILMTAEGLRQVQTELEHLRTVVKKQALERVKTAMQFGEPMENSELEEAKAEQAAVEGRILELTRLLHSARVVAPAEADGTVHIGTMVRLKEVATGEESEFRLVGAMEADPAQQRISNQSPVGQALMGKRKGDRIVVSTPAGNNHFVIVSVE